MEGGGEECLVCECLEVAGWVVGLGWCVGDCIVSGKMRVLGLEFEYAVSPFGFGGESREGVLEG